MVRELLPKTARLCHYLSGGIQGTEANHINVESNARRREPYNCSCSSEWGFIGLEQSRAGWLPLKNIVPKTVAL